MPANMPFEEGAAFRVVYDTSYGTKKPSGGVKTKVFMGVSYPPTAARSWNQPASIVFILNCPETIMANWL
jgi:hypothetical protein